MDGSSKNNRENYPRKCFEHKKKKPRLNLTEGWLLIGLRATGPRGLTCRGVMSRAFTSRAFISRGTTSRGLKSSGLVSSDLKSRGLTSWSLKSRRFTSKGFYMNFSCIQGLLRPPIVQPRFLHLGVLHLRINNCSFLRYLSKTQWQIFSVHGN